jgi:hypothetical protein
VPLLSAADLDFALQACSGSLTPNVVYGAQSCYGDVKREPVVDATSSGLQRIGTHVTLVIRDGALTGLADDSAITVNGSAFTIRDVGIAHQDGTRMLTLVDG